jgi:hypothetical protein
MDAETSKWLGSIDGRLEALTHFLVDMPKGTEVADATRNVALAWTKLAELTNNGDLNDYALVVVGECGKDLRTATNLLEKLYARKG